MKARILNDRAIMVGVRPMMSLEVRSLGVTDGQGVEEGAEGEEEELLPNRCRCLGRGYLDPIFLQDLDLLTLHHDLWWNMIQALLQTKRVRIRIWIQSKMPSLQNHPYQKMCNWCHVVILVPLWKS